MSLTDRNHRDKVVQAGIAAIMDLGELWGDEDDNACFPRSGSGDGPVSGGGISDPTLKTATGRGDGMVEDTKYRHRDRLGQVLLDHVNALVAEVKRHQPRHERDLPPCHNCGAAPAISGGRCDFCGPFYRHNRFDRPPDEARDFWRRKDETRPCYECGEPIPKVQGRRKCQRCVKAERRRRKGEAA